MKLTIILLTALVAQSATASWFTHDKPAYDTWDAKQLKQWLRDHDIRIPEGYSQKELQALVKTNWVATTEWTQEQYEKAQQVLGDFKESAFDSWDESRLREFLLEQGVVAPSGPREQLVLAAKQHYSAYSSAASAFGAGVTSAASYAVHGDSAAQHSKSISSVSKTISSVAAEATSSVARKLDDTKDYVYSEWSDSEIKGYLEKQGVLKAGATTTREKLLAHMKDAYAAVTDPIWDAWSDSYIHHWLVAHGVIKSDFDKRRDKLITLMKKYYYDPQEYVWSTWTESDLRSWLLDHDIIKGDAQLKVEKMRKLVADNYVHAADTVFGGWKNSDLRGWLIEHGYLRSDEQIQRDKLLKLMNAKYNEASARTAAYTAWPDARLRAFLRNHGLPEDKLPTSRPGLLQEARIRYVQSSSMAEQLFNKVRGVINGGVETAEETIGHILETLSGSHDSLENQKRREAAEIAKEKDRAAHSHMSVASSLSSEAVKASKVAKAEL